MEQAEKASLKFVRPLVSLIGILPEIPLKNCDLYCQRNQSTKFYINYAHFKYQRRHTYKLPYDVLRLAIYWWVQ